MKEIIKGQKIALKDLAVTEFSVAFSYKNPQNYDIDISVMMLSERGKLEEENDLIFYNNPVSADGSINIKNDNQSFQKTIYIDSAKIPNNISRLMFVMTIEDGDKLNKRFENINDMTVHILKGNEKVFEYSVAGLTKETAVILIEIYKHNNEWKIQATGNGFNAGLDAIIKNYGSEKVQIQEDNNSVPQITIPTVTEKKSEIKLEKIPKGSIDFVKKYKERIDLVKKHVADMGINSQKAQVTIVMDVSASMSHLFKTGVVQDTFDRVLPLAMQFDDDGIIDTWLFDDRVIHSKVPYTYENRENYVKKEIEEKYKLGYGTNYAPPINNIVNSYDSSNSLPLFVLFFTDGNCFDKKETEQAMRNASSKPIFWKFIGMGGNKPGEKKGFFSKLTGTGFEFLEKLDDLSGRVIDNANFIHIYDLNAVTDEQIYKDLLNEFPQWISEARKKGILR